jgi:hypothetical protein
MTPQAIRRTHVKMVAYELEPRTLDIAARAAAGIGGDDRQLASGAGGHGKACLDLGALHTSTSECR